ncbi:MAG: efflux RND transporter periplasmic adaptor subunit [Helicobacter sp.]|nr:efflux RND transporter periplasmic adaptor subunit [Helicobacter sp.]
MDIYETLYPKKKIFWKRWVFWLGICIVLLGGCGVYLWNFHTPSVGYESISPKRGEIKSSISASGSLSPTNEVEIGSVISGIVLEVLVEENDRVKKGQVLARINPESINQELARYNAQLNSAKAQLRASKQTLEDKKWNYERLKNLYKKTGGKSPSILELQSAKTAYTSAYSDVDIKKATIVEIETNIASSKINLKNSKIVSPIDGVVLSKSVEVGQSVAASFQAPVLFKVAENLQEMILKAYVSEADIGKVKEGQEVSFSVDSYPDKIFYAQVNKVNFGSGDGSSTSSSSSAGASTIVSYIAHIEVDNQSLLLRPDMSATADITIAHANDALLVPSSALYFDLNKAIQRADTKLQQGSFFSSMFAPPRRPRAQFNTPQNKLQGKNGLLWILKDGVPESVNVEIGISDGQYTQILSGIDEKTRVITGIKNLQ